MVLIIQPWRGAIPLKGDVTQEAVSAEKAAIISDAIGIGLAFIGAVAGALSVIFNKLSSVSLHNSVVGFWYILSNVLLCPVWSFIQQR